MLMPSPSPSPMNNGHVRPRRSVSDTMLPPPVECGLPAHFPAWRRHQDEAIFRVVESTKRFVVLCLPTGFGKSLAYMALAALSGKRTCVLTSTKGLQDQLYRDFHSIGLEDVRGMGNYPCNYLVEVEKTPLFVKEPLAHAHGPSCDIGPCLGGMACAYRNSGCDYYNAVSVARHAPFIVTNYAYWLHSKPPAEASDRNQGIGRFDMLVLDEAHNSPEELGSYLSFTVTKNQTSNLLGVEWPQDHDDWPRWKRWAVETSAVAKLRLGEMESLVKRGIAGRTQLRQYKELKSISDGLGRIGFSEGTWVSHMVRRGDRGLLTLNFDPVWPGEYADRNLFRAIPKIVLTSATVHPKTLDLLGVRPDQMDFIEYPSSFPVSRRPVYWSPTVRVDSRTDPTMMRMWVAKIDNIIRKRLDRKGIIHTVSYARRDFIMRHSEFAPYMMTHETATARETVEKFKRARPGTILVSPSMATGYDFPYDQCHYQIIGKIPFPDTRDKVVKARTVVDRDYPMYLAMQQLVQATGRGMRAEDDICETIIVDDNASWFMGKYGQTLAPKWFMQAYKRLPRGTVPEPPVTGVEAGCGRGR